MKMQGCFSNLEQNSITILVNQGLSTGNDRWIQKSAKTNWELLKIVILYKMKKSRISKGEQLLKKLRYACKFRPDIAKSAFKGEWTSSPSDIFATNSSFHVK